MTEHKCVGQGTTFRSWFSHSAVGFRDGIQVIKLTWQELLLNLPITTALGILFSVESLSGVGMTVMQPSSNKWGEVFPFSERHHIELCWFLF